MVLKIIHNHNLLPEGIYQPDYPLEHICAFTYNSQIYALQLNSNTKILSIVSALIPNTPVVVIGAIGYGGKDSLNIIEYSDNILWIGCEFTFCICDLVSMVSRKYDSDFNTRFITPVGRDYWMYINGSSSVPVFTWDLLTRLERYIIPTVIEEPGARYYPITACGPNVSYIGTCPNLQYITFMNSRLDIISNCCVLNYFPNYKKLVHSNPEIFTELQSLITVNDNCLLYYEWFDFSLGPTVGCESKLCFDFTTGQIIPFANNQLDYLVLKIFPFRDFDGIIKLCSHENYLGNSWKTIYEPENVNGSTVLGKRKADVQITPGI